LRWWHEKGLRTGGQSLLWEKELSKQEGKWGEGRFILPEAYEEFETRTIKEKLTENIGKFLLIRL
jgi:hypothetical protein